MHNTWGNNANNLRIASWSAGDERPQNHQQTTINDHSLVYNHHFIPFLPDLFLYSFPQVFSINDHWKKLSIPHYPQSLLIALLKKN